MGTDLLKQRPWIPVLTTPWPCGRELISTCPPPEQQWQSPALLPSEHVGFSNDDETRSINKEVWGSIVDAPRHAVFPITGRDSHWLIAVRAAVPSWEMQLWGMNTQMTCASRSHSYNLSKDAARCFHCHKACGRLLCLHRTLLLHVENLERRFPPCWWPRRRSISHRPDTDLPSPTLPYLCLRPEVAG